MNDELPFTPNVPLTMTCPIKVCVSDASSPNTLEPLENITEADSSNTCNILVLTVSKVAILAETFPTIVTLPSTSIEPVCIQEPLTSTLPLNSAFPLTIKLSDTLTFLSKVIVLLPELIITPRFSPRPS